MAYLSKRTGEEVDALLDKVERGDFDITIDTELSEESNNAIANSAVTNAIGKLPNKKGRYPDMTVGKAENLVGRGEATEEEFTFRPSAGDISIEDGSARITAIKGNSVVYNQGAYRTKTQTWNDGSTSFLPEGVVEFTGITNATSISVGTTYKMVPSHLYLSIVEVLSMGQVENMTFGNSNLVNGRYTFTEAGIYQSISQNTRNDYSYIGISSVAIGTDMTGVKVRYRIIDLTQMFCAGNEPTSYEEYLQRKPINIADEFAYNDGELINMNVEAIKSVGENAFDSRVGYAKVLGGKTYNFEGTYTKIEFSTTLNGARETITLNAENKYTFESDGYVFAEGTDICINLQHSYNKDITHQYEDDVLDLSIVMATFTEGMRSVVSVYDEICFNKTTEKWEKVDRIGTRAYEEGDTEDSSVMTDGTTTNYPLVTPIVEDLDMSFNPDYLIWDFGMEEAIASVPSAPFRADIIYQFNAVDRIRNNSDRIAELESQIESLMQTISTMQTTNVEE